MGDGATMNLTQVRAVWIPRPKRKRVGRGEASGVGKTSGYGHKGQKARAGYSRRPYFAGGQMPIIRRIPKRGFHNPWGTRYAIVNCADLDRFADGERVDVERLQAAGLVKRLEDGVKVLGGGALTKKLTVRAHQVSAAAKAKIEKAGGTVEVVDKVTSPRPKAPPAPPKDKSQGKTGKQPPEAKAPPPAQRPEKPAKPGKAEGQGGSA